MGEEPSSKSRQIKRIRRVDVSVDVLMSANS
jgi:hypothetical protein